MTGSRATRGIVAAVLVVVATAAGTSGSAGASRSSEYHPEHVLVAFRDGVPRQARSALHASLDGSVANRLEWLGIDVVRLPAGIDPPRASAAYARSPLVAYAHPNWKVRLLGVPNDPLFGDQWGHHNTGQLVKGNTAAGTPDADIDAPEGWDAAFGAGSFPSSGGIRVGVLDTGIDAGHVDLLGKTKACASAVLAIGRVVEGTCSDDNLHGTHVAGIVAAIANNGTGVAGVAPNAELAVFKALNSAGVGFYADIIAGINWLRTTGQARVINMSFGGEQDDALDRALRDADAAGVLLVAAAGNEGDATLSWPAAHRDVVSVGATDAKDRAASFSNCNGDVEVSAPGVTIWSTIPGSAYAPLDGTSMASPYAAAVGATIMWRKQVDNVTARAQLANTAEDRGPSGWDPCYGWGRVNLAAALGGLQATMPEQPPGAIAGRVTDHRTGAGIGGATVDCGSGVTATTAPTGAYAISDVEPGSYNCTASADGYRSKTQNVVVDPGETQTADFRLHASGGAKTSGAGR